MALGVTAVPAISSAYESDSPKFNLLINSVLKYTSILSCFSGIVLHFFQAKYCRFFTAIPMVILQNSAVIFCFILL